MKFVQRNFLSLSLTLVLIATAGTAPAQSLTQTAGIWTGTWAASQQIPEPQNSLPPEDLRDATVRQIFHLSIGGKMVRVRLSNTFGTKPLHFTSVHIARPLSLSSPQIDPATDKAVTFSGSSDVIVPAGADYVSDPISYSVAALSSLAVTFHLDDPPVGETGHPGSRATSYYVHGDLVSAADLPEAKRVDHWYQISGIDVIAAQNASAIAVLGDSITDGHAATTDGNDRWTDVLAARLQDSAATRNIAVLNEGIGGNHLLTDGLGPNALARFDRDVISQTGVRYVIVLEAVNDLGDLTRLGDVSSQAHSEMVHRIIAAYEQIIARAHAHGIKAIGATILPDVGSTYYHPGPSSEADRQAVNTWIRARGHFDAVIDFDKIMRDPQQPDRLLPAYDSGDHLHPSPAGYHAMGAAVPLSLFAR
ncbi:MAG TPA: SGNH/GDSL hydrolase family protein [Candidatus Acidoferrales bacterium]|nr:SGNH/GDSL hydrolase family protein [Candidatus Acidoferrales bacterium]